MNKQEKIDFITSLCDNMKESLIKKVDKMPENWDGHQLRQYISDYAGQNANWIKMTRKQKSDYNNDILVNGL